MNKLASLDYDKIPYHKIQYLPLSYNGNVIFELPPSCVSASTSKNTMDDMDKQLDGHIWCSTITSDIHNNQGLTFRKSLCIGQLVCENKSCDFFTKSSMHNEIKRLGQTNTQIKLGHVLPSDSILICKVDKVTPICVNFCPGRIYYVLGRGDMSRACIHLGMHNHPVSDGIYRETLDTISSLITHEVSKPSTAKNSAIAMVASKEFLDKYFIHTSPGSKKMLQGQELEDILDKFEHLSSPNL